MPHITLETTSPLRVLLRDFDAIRGSLEPFRPIWPHLVDLPITSRFEADETDTGYSFTMALPGFKKAEVKVSVEGQQLSVVGESEKRGVKVSRSITLPSDTDLGSAEATLEDGLLVVSLKKRPEGQSRAVEVR